MVFTEVMGLFVSDEDDQRVYLRAWQDRDDHTLILTKADRPGLEHLGWRVETPQDLPAFEKRLRELDIEYHWVEGGEELGQGDGLRFVTPAGVPTELYWERERFANENPNLHSKLPSHPQKYVGRGSPRGASIT